MNRKALDVAELEESYRLLAETVDRVGSDQESLFLAKLVLMLANQLGDIEFVRGAIEQAARDLRGLPATEQDAT